MNLERASEELASWLRAIQAEGRPCPTNLTQSARMVLKCSREIANRVKKILVNNGRLQLNPMRGLFVIDGFYFDRNLQPEDEVGQIKTILQKHYMPVYDPRTVAHEDKVAAGEPVVLVIGRELVPFSQARVLAHQIAAGAIA